MYKGAIELLNGFPDPADIGMPQRRKNTWVIKLGSHLGAARCCNGTARAASRRGTNPVRSSIGVVFKSRLQPSPGERAGLRLDPPNPSLSPALGPRYSLPRRARPHPRFSHSSKPTFPLRTLPFILLYLLLAHSFTYFTYIPHSLPTTPHTLRRQPSPPVCLDRNIPQHCKPPLDIFRNVVQHHVQHFGYNREP